uniref:Cadherin-12 n=1 Tax=Lepisosteus oculatus TaxID=7918 RepID=W5N2X3_LEPOC
MNCSAWLPMLIAFSMMGCCVTNETRTKLCLKTPSLNKEQYISHRRLRRGWIWKQFFVPEEDPAPRTIGQLKSDYDKVNFSIKYILSGEGAGDVFRIDEDTGEIYTMKKLDREKKSSYILRAQAIDRLSMQPVEPESEFIIKVQDINDNVPEFQNEPYVATIAEMCPTGTTVIQVTATDADDPSYGNNARLIYSILQGQPYFSVEPTTGTIVTSWPDMDREAKEQHLVIVQVKDMMGLRGGFSATTTVTINLSDVNDNGPKFQHKFYSFPIPESAPVGTIIGRIMAEDRDVGLNGMMNYTIEETDSTGVFEILTDPNTQEGVIILQKALDYENRRRFTISVEAINAYIDIRFLTFNQFRDKTTVKVTVENVDEPPLFFPHEYYWEILENTAVGTAIGRVNAYDRDAANNPVRYYFDERTNMNKMFSIDQYNGTITIAKPLDRETAHWHNLTVSARETRENYLFSKAQITIQVMDVNDNAPQFSKQYTPYVCEGTQSGEMMQSIQRVQRTKNNGNVQIIISLCNIMYFFLTKIVSDNTAGVLTRRSSFSRKDRAYYYLPIVIVDNGTPALTSTTTLTIEVCSCYPDGNCRSNGVEAFALSIGLSIETLIAISSCLLIIVVLSLLILAVKRHKKKQLGDEKWEEVAENVVCYNEKGYGEEDTHAIVPVILRSNPKQRNRRTHKEEVAASIRMSLRQSFLIGPEDEVFRQFILERLFEADTDPYAPPFDYLHTFAYEGTGSAAGSLSSLGSWPSEQNYDYICDSGPCFKRLAYLYVGGHEETD